METETTEIDIDAPADAVWPLVGDFGGLIWMPGVDAVTVDGDRRTVTFAGMDVTEQLVSLDEDARQISYSIVDGPVPIDHHTATVTVTPTEAGCHVTWSVTSAPEGTAGFFRDTYAGALAALKAKAESDT